MKRRTSHISLNCVKRMRVAHGVCCDFIVTANVISRKFYYIHNLNLLFCPIVQHDSKEKWHKIALDATYLRRVIMVVMGWLRPLIIKKHQADLHNTPWLTDFDNRYKTAIFLLRYCSLKRLTINKAHKEPVSYLWVHKVLANDKNVT